MDDLTKLLNSELKKIIKRIKREFEPSKSYQGQGCKRRKTSLSSKNESCILNSSDFSHKDVDSHNKRLGERGDELYLASLNKGQRKRESLGDADKSFEERKLDLKASSDLGGDVLSRWEAEALSDVLEGFYTGWGNEECIIKNHVLLNSIWQRLHTGHWSGVPLGFRSAYTWGSINLVGLLLRQFLAGLEGRLNSPENTRKKAAKIVQACDRGLLMGKPVEKNPLTAVASLLNGVAMGGLCPRGEGEEEGGVLPLPRPGGDIPPSFPLPLDIVPDEAAPFTMMTPLESQHLLPLQQFLITHMEGGRPLKLLGVADGWPALSKWDFNFFRRVAGARTVPVEVGLRYSDSNWSQTLMTMDSYISSYLSPAGEKEGRAYLAQHQLCDQIPELLPDIMIPDYCRMGERDPVVNVWIGPQGTVTPLHHDPDHNILVQVHGYKVIVIFPEGDSKSLYAFEDELLSNTSRVNLEEEVKSKSLFEDWPLLKGVKGHYLTLGPGDAIYLPPKWWHYVRALSNSISVSFWWR